jgi:hypothetical protein
MNPFSGVCGPNCIRQIIFKKTNLLSDSSVINVTVPFSWLILRQHLHLKEIDCTCK